MKHKNFLVIVSENSFSHPEKSIGKPEKNIKSVIVSVVRFVLYQHAVEMCKLHTNMETKSRVIITMLYILLHKPISNFIIRDASIMQENF